MKNRELLELEQQVLIRQREGINASATEVLRGALDAINWLLAGRVSPAPLTGVDRDPDSAAEVSKEAVRAEEVWFGFGANDPSLSPSARNGNVGRYANGVSKTLAWACGSSEDDAFGRVDEDIALAVEGS